MSYWVKIFYERNEYVINFERVTAFCREQNGRITFWLPDCAIPIVINLKSNPEDYQKILNFVEQVKELGFEKSYWVKILYERNEYIINLNCISSFRYEPNNGRITFWLPNSTVSIIIHPLNNPESYTKILEYIQQTTGYILAGTNSRN
ncbi:hypothetical protein [Brasilonema sp. UFV-L1]|uniref:hypothetical protein n=1 Tax=Brasilonema sp. UFV-L1 TaxID=2234130 RepID=UPI00145E58C8|nr:hypothetical protein [Brasilonema sp. UFV-L1]NMG09124.1 hypothetical protein [Brasilonema sp. UFV-L1]